MAGLYPDVPANRITYNLDGTAGYRIPASNVPVALTSTQMNNLNDESGENGQGVSANDDCQWWCFVFPSLRDISHWYVTYVAGSIASEYSGQVQAGRNVQTSADTTNGVDGTWTTVATSWGMTGVTSPGYRSLIGAFPGGGAGIKGIRFNPGLSGAGFNYLVTLHLFGGYSSGENPDRLRFWHPTLDQALSVTPAYLDWGDVLRGSTATKQVRVKNNSASQTAQGVTVSTAIVRDQSPSVPPQFTLSTDGTTFGATASLGNLAPGATSGVITVKRSTSTTAVLSVVAPRLSTAVTGWA